MSWFAGAERAIRVAVCARTDTGVRRSENQDRYLVANLTEVDREAPLMEGGADGDRAPWPSEFVLGPRGALFLVADGMGGAAAGATASALASRTIFQVMARLWGSERTVVPRRFAEHLVAAVEQASRLIRDRAESDLALSGMGTTATAVGVLDGILYLAQVGDSRAYLIRGAEGTQLTRDQSVVQTMREAGTLTEEEAQNSPHTNLILQALGTSPEIEVDLTYQELRRGDVLLVCSDGLSGPVRRSEMSEIVAGTPDLAGACEALVELARSRGGPDNITAVLARFRGEGLELPDAEDLVQRRAWSLGDS